MSILHHASVTGGYQPVQWGWVGGAEYDGGGGGGGGGGGRGGGA